MCRIVSTRVVYPFITSGLASAVAGFVGSGSSLARNAWKAASLQALVASRWNSSCASLAELSANLKKPAASIRKSRLAVVW
jgi:hypothetical protein